jgi:hypothetical protein
MQRKSSRNAPFVSILRLTLLITLLLMTGCGSSEDVREPQSNEETAVPTLRAEPQDEAAVMPISPPRYCCP